MLSWPAFAYDGENDVFYSGFAGRPSEFGTALQPTPISLWSFKPDGVGGGTWKQEIENSDPAFDHLTLPARGYQAHGGEAALNLGGFTTPNDTPSPGLLQLNMTARSFTNSSAKSFNAAQDSVYGQMHYVPSFGPNGIFTIMGGNNLGIYGALFGLDNIWVYEPVMDEWFNQTATGDIPKNRIEFCTAGLNSTNGTYEIFLYGGVNGCVGPAAVPYDEIFVLTLPAFHWFKVDYPPRNPRHDHTCNAVGGSQIISIGGLDSNSQIYVNTTVRNIVRSTFNSTADPFTQGLAIFDMTTLAWADHYTANAPPYEQSDLVKSFYSAHPQNGSQFTDSRLKTLFQATHFSQTPLAATNLAPTSIPTPPAAPSPTTKPASFSSRTNKGTIAGGVSGGAVGISLLAGLAYYFYRRKHQGYPKPRKSSDVPELQGNRHPPQEVHGNTRPNEMEGQAVAELGSPVDRQEMGYHEATGVERWPYELDGREVGK